jgi:hypothetical protein
MATDSVPYWLLISVLFSTVPLTEALAVRLHRAALDLYRRNRGVAKLQGDLAQGEVRNLKKDLLLGTLGGPGFEAHLDTERGSGVVRFLLTRQGIEMMAERERPSAAMN